MRCALLQKRAGRRRSDAGLRRYFVSNLTQHPTNVHRPSRYRSRLFRMVISWLRRSRRH
jgi:hypothetical protein